MSGSSTISITISAADLASAKFDALTKQILGLQNTAGHAGGALRKVADPAPLQRLGEGMKAFGDNTLAAARAVERVASPMALLTGAASIAGMVELSRRWAEMGNTVLKTSTALDMPVAQLSNMTMAARLAGSTAESMNTSLNGVFQTIKDAQFKIGDTATPIWQQLGINPLDKDGKARNPADVLRDYAAAMKGMDAHRRYTIEIAAHIDPNLDVFLKDGAEGFDANMARAARTGGAWTEKMATDARALRGSWEELGETLEGTFNRIEDRWEPFQQHMLDGLSHWMQKNQQLSDSLTEVLIPAISGLALIKPAMWLLRLLGLDAVAAPVLPAAAATASVYELTHIASTQSQAQEDAILGGSFAQRHPGNVLGPVGPGGGPPAETFGPPLPAYLGGPVVPPPPGGWPSTTLPAAPSTTLPAASAASAAPDDLGLQDYARPNLALPRGIRNNNPGNLNFVGQPGATLEYPGGRFARFRTMAEGVAALGSQLGRYGDRGLDTIDKIIHTYAPAADNNDTAAYIRHMMATTGFGANQHLDLHDPVTVAAMERGISGMENGAAYADAGGQIGSVHVTIDLHGAPAGTTGTATAEGNASVSPPRVATAMGHIS